MSKNKNDGLTRSGTGCSIQLYPYGNSGRQRVLMPIKFRIEAAKDNESPETGPA